LCWLIIVISLAVISLLLSVVFAVIVAVGVVLLLLLQFLLHCYCSAIAILYCFIALELLLHVRPTVWKPYRPEPLSVVDSGMNNIMLVRVARMPDTGTVQNDNGLAHVGNARTLF
jgi:hypothetical protein